MTALPSAQPLVCHIGLTKTASTWLQEAYWPRHPDAALVASRQALANMLPIWQPDGSLPDAARERLSESIHTIRRNGRVPILSQEELGPALMRPQLGALNCLQEFSAMDANMRIVVLLRHPAEWAVAAWQQQVKGGAYWRPLERFVWADRRRARLTGLVQGGTLYAHLVRRLHEIVGRENVHVELFEQFKEAPHVVLDRMDAFMGLRIRRGDRDVGAPRNRTLSKRSTDLLRPLSRLSAHLPRAAWRIMSPPAVRRLHRLDRRLNWPSASTDESILVALRARMNLLLADEMEQLRSLRPELPLRRFGYPGLNASRGRLGIAAVSLELRQA